MPPPGGTAASVASASGHREERLNKTPVRDDAELTELRIAFRDVSGIAQHRRAKINRRGSSVNRPVKSFLHQQR